MVSRSLLTSHVQARQGGGGSGGGAPKTRGRSSGAQRAVLALVGFSWDLLNYALPRSLPDDSLSAAGGFWTLAELTLPRRCPDPWTGLIR